MVARAIVPTGIEAKAVQFAEICGRDGYPDATLVVKDGRVARMSLFDLGGSQRFFEAADGGLFEYYMPDEGDAL